MSDQTPADVDLENFAKETVFVKINGSVTAFTRIPNMFGRNEYYNAQSGDSRYFMKRIAPGNSYGSHGHNCVEREVIVYDMVKDADIVPPIVHFNTEMQYIVTKYSGRPLHDSDMNEEMYSQIIHIIDVLELHNIQHNDIKKHGFAKNEFLIDEHGKIRLCDFGYAIIEGSRGSKFGLSEFPKHFGSSPRTDRTICEMLYEKWLAEKRASELRHEHDDVTTE
jgi:serine/threonine protein kinase